MHTYSEKSRRHRLILDAISENQISNQEQLVECLKSNNISVTQPTLSRDLRELRIVRVPNGNSYCYQPPTKDTGISPVAGLPEKLREIASLVVAAIKSSDTVVALTTLPGRAQGLAQFLDSCNLPEIMATVAGDDTVVVFPTNSKQTERLRRRLVSLLDLQ